MTAPAAGLAVQGQAGGRRSAIPYHCPFCADEDLRPHLEPGAWHCRSCLRVFSVRFHAIEGLDATETPTPGSPLAAPPVAGNAARPPMKSPGQPPAAAHTPTSPTVTAGGLR